MTASAAESFVMVVQKLPTTLTSISAAEAAIKELDQLGQHGSVSVKLQIPFKEEAVGRLWC